MDIVTVDFSIDLNMGVLFFSVLHLYINIYCADTLNKSSPFPFCMSSNCIRSLLSLICCGHHCYISRIFLFYYEWLWLLKYCVFVLFAPRSYPSEGYPYRVSKAQYDVSLVDNIIMILAGSSL